MGAPTGTVTFLFTDIEGSTLLWDAAPDAMRSALAIHDVVVRGTIEAHGGYVFSTGGDGFAAAFGRAREAASAAVAAQATLAGTAWPDAAVIAVRMGLHTGEVEERGGDYFGTPVNQAARLMALGHGGQVLCSAVTAALLDGVELVDLGEHRLRDLSAPQRIFQLGSGRFRPLRSVDAFPGNLPLQVSSFVGREADLARVEKALHEARVVTLTGVGGVGKTRLALQAAAEVLPRFREGAWLVELAPVRDPGGVAPAFAGVFGVNPSAGQSMGAALAEFLRSKQLLLVADNCEHVIDAVGDLVELLERSCPGLVVLATSREGLALDGERVVPVPPLAGPPTDASIDALAESDAVRLFVERATAVDPDFTLDARNGDAVGQVCRRLDGVPLAIELAAARVGAITPAELARRLDRRFDALAGGRRRAVQRHQTLRAAIDWSYELCSEGERRLLGRLAVFSGGCTCEAAEAVCGSEPITPHQVFDLLAGLVAKSLVVAHREGPETRYRLLETIREYGEERLAEHGETEALRRRHAEYYAAFEREAFAIAFGPRQLEVAERLGPEHDNLLAAMNHAVDGDDVDLAMRLLRFVPFGVLVGVSAWVGAGSELAFHEIPIEAMLGLSGAADHRWYPFAVAAAAIGAASRGDLETFEDRVDEARRAAAQPDAEEDWLVDYTVATARGIAALGTGAHDEYAAHAEHAAAIARSGGQLGWAAACLGNGAVEHALAGDSGAAAAAEGLELARRVGLPSAVGVNLNALALAAAGDDPDRARALLAESRCFRAGLGYEHVVELAQDLLVSARLGDWSDVLGAAPTAIRYYQWVNSPSVLAGVVNVAARAIAQTDPERAAVLQGGARRIAMSSGLARPEPHPAGASGVRAPDRPSQGNVGLVADLRRQTTGPLADALGEDRVRALRAEGGAMDVDEIVAFALAAIDRACGHQ